jgi:hypothetical protein
MNSINNHHHYGYEARTSDCEILIKVVPIIAKVVAAFFCFLAQQIASASSWIWNRVICCKQTDYGHFKTGVFSPIDRSINGLGNINIGEKRQIALDRLEEITNKNLYFDIPIEFNSFDLDLALEPYDKTRPLHEIIDLFDYAGPDLTDPLSTGYLHAQKKIKLIACANDYPLSSIDQYGTARESISQLIDIWTRKRNKATLGQYDEEDLKDEIRQQLAALIDAHVNCIDQVNAQLEGILMEVLVSELSPRESQSKAKMLTSFALFKYRSNLIKEICIQLYPDLYHMADFERFVKQRFASQFGLNGDSVTTGAYHSNCVRGKESEADCVLAEFIKIYTQVAGPDRRPGLFLKQGLQHYYGDKALKTLRREILLEVENEYQINNSYDSDFSMQDPVLKKLIKLASADDQDAFIDGLSWSDSGCLWFMEQAGLIRETTLL